MALAIKNSANNNHLKTLDAILADPLSAVRMSLHNDMQALAPGYKAMVSQKDPAKAQEIAGKLQQASDTHFNEDRYNGYIAELRKFAQKDMGGQNLAAFDRETAKMKQAIETGDTTFEPNPNVRVAQLAWAATLSYLTVNPKVQENWPDKNKAFDITDSKVWNKVLTSDVIENELLDHAFHLNEEITNKDTKLRWGAPGSWFYNNPKEPAINLDLIESLTLGLEHTRAAAYHEMGHNKLTVKLPKSMTDILGKLEDQDEKISKGGKLTKDEYVERQKLAAEMQARHKIFNVCEDNTVNQYATRQSVSLDYSVSINYVNVLLAGTGVLAQKVRDNGGEPVDLSDNNPLSKHGTGDIVPGGAEAQSPEAEAQKKFENVQHALNMSFFQNNGLFPNTEKGWKSVNVHVDWITEDPTYPGATGQTSQEALAHLQDLCQQLEDLQPARNAKRFGEDAVKKMIPQMADKRIEIYEEIWDRYVKQFAEPLIEKAEEQAQDNADPQKGDGQDGEKSDQQQGEKGDKSDKSDKSDQKDGDKSDQQQNDQENDGQDAKDGQDKSEQKDGDKSDQQQSDEQQSEEQNSKENDGQDAKDGQDNKDQQKQDKSDQQQGDQNQQQDREDGTVPVEDKGDLPDNASPENRPKDPVKEEEKRQQEEQEAKDKAEQDAKDQAEKDAQDAKDGDDGKENDGQDAKDGEDKDGQEQDGNEKGDEKGDEGKEGEGQDAKDGEEKGEGQDGEGQEGEGQEGEGQEGQGQDAKDGNGNPKDGRTVDQLMKERDQKQKEAADKKAKEDAERQKKKQQAEEGEGEGMGEGSGSGMSLADLKVGDWRNYDEMVKEYDAPIREMANILKKIREKKVIYQRETSREHSLIPEDGEMGRFDGQKHVDRIKKERTGQDLDDTDFETFKKDQKSAKPADDDMVVAIDLSGSMASGQKGARPVDIAIQFACILREAGKRAGVDVHILGWGEKGGGRWLATPDMPNEDVGNNIDGVKNAAGWGTDFAPAVNEIIEMYNKEKKNANAAVGDTHIMVASDGDLFDDKQSNIIVQRLLKSCPNVTMDVAIINKSTDTNMDKMVNTQKQSRAHRQIDALHAVGPQEVQDMMREALQNRLQVSAKADAISQAEKQARFRQAKRGAAMDGFGR